MEERLARSGVTSREVVLVTGGWNLVDRWVLVVPDQHPARHAGEDIRPAPRSAFLSGCKSLLPERPCLIACVSARRVPASSAVRHFRLWEVASQECCKSGASLGSRWLSLGGGHLLVEGVRVGLLVFDAVEVLAVDVGERCAVAGVAEEQVEDCPDE